MTWRAFNNPGEHNDPPRLNENIMMTKNPLEFTKRLTRLYGHVTTRNPTTQASSSSGASDAAFASVRGFTIPQPMILPRRRRASDSAPLSDAAAVLRQGG